ncbi:MAG: TIGR01906 family membrane protein [Clostridia bacterium]
MKKISNIAISLCIFLFIVSFATVVTLNFRTLYYINVDSQNLAETSGYSQETIIENYDILIDYNSIFNFSELEFNGLEMSDEGKIHFEEVKAIFVGIQVLLILTFIGTVFGVYKKIKQKDFDFLLMSSVITIVLPVVLGTIIAINWQWCFITFHKIAFRNDYWIFDPIKDPIITLLPDSFFMQCAIMIVSIILLISATMLVFWLVKKNNKINDTIIN